MAKRTLEQLKNTTWSTKEAMAKDFKASGVPLSGADYEPGQTPAGSWMAVDRTDAASDAPAEKPAPKVKKLPERAARGMRMSPQAKKAPAAKKKAAAKKAAPEPEQPEPEAKKEPEPVPDPEAGDYRTPLPHLGKPYRIVAHEGGGYPAHATHSWAVVISRAINGPVDVLDKDGNVVRTINATKIKSAARAENGSRKGAVRAKRDPNAGPNAMMQKAIELAVRKEGVTREQLKDVSPKQQPWTMLLKDAVKWGYEYSTAEAPEGSRSRTVYHLKKTS
jgi:hypothetical protein